MRVLRPYAAPPIPRAGEIQPPSARGPSSDGAGMKPQKQLIRHDPANGQYGDCHRTAIACVLDMDAADVPHFMDRTPGKGEAPEAERLVEAWLNERGVTQISIIFPGSLTADEVMTTVMNVNSQRPGLAFLLGGESRTGVNHTVVCRDGKIVCDPSQTDAGIVGPCDDGYYWVTFFGSIKALHRETPPGAALKTTRPL